MLLLAGGLAGGIAGLLPFLIAKKRGQRRLALIAMLSCIASGVLGLGLLFSVMVALGLTVVSFLMNAPSDLDARPEARRLSRLPLYALVIIVLLVSLLGIGASWMRTESLDPQVWWLPVTIALPNVVPFLCLFLFARWDLAKSGQLQRVAVARIIGALTGMCVPNLLFLFAVPFEFSLSAYDVGQGVAALMLLEIFLVPLFGLIGGGIGHAMRRFGPEIP